MRSLSEIALVLLLAAPVRAEDDPFAAYRERFKIGMERYKAGDLGEAIRYWEPILRDLGPSKGYRLAYNLAVAYQEHGDATRAAERLLTFLTEVEARRERKETLEQVVVKEEADARSRLAALNGTKGRIRIPAGALAVQIDAVEPRLAGFVAYVAPGPHTVVFGPGTSQAEKKEVTVGAGEIIEVAPTPPPPPPKVEPPPPPPPPKVEPPPPPPPRTRTLHEVERPFSPVVLYVGGGLTVASVIIPVVTYSNAFDIKSEHDSSTSSETRQHLEARYDGVRTGAYATLAIPITLAAATAGLSLWYFLGSREKITVVPVVGAGTVGVRGRF
jgi:hypothetical protein